MPVGLVAGGMEHIGAFGGHEVADLGDRAAGEAPRHGYIRHGHCLAQGLGQGAGRGSQTGLLQQQDTHIRAGRGQPRDQPGRSLLGAVPGPRVLHEENDLHPAATVAERGGKRKSAGDGKTLPLPPPLV